ncbi:hypothetical protein BT96DRAFT_1025751 [Gymnopus androsaceus JB14]|uniref:Uncharacterized protein n=1 Tax=Gymnopus androsaceus JB14 TaxID=1447944 RepID=A0A6A4GR49_9AGAR|nr:hypothetical protein BT96DRAFT_1025751 [Gymnopus androsaceus JB14]
MCSFFFDHHHRPHTLLPTFCPLTGKARDKMWPFDSEAATPLPSLTPPPRVNQVLQIPTDGSAPHILPLRASPTEYMWFWYLKGGEQSGIDAGLADWKEKNWFWDSKVAKDRSRLALPDVRSFWEPMGHRLYDYGSITLDRSQYPRSPSCHGTYINPAIHAHAKLNKKVRPFQIS